MRRVSVLTLIGIATLWVGGCATAPGGETPVSTTPEAVPIPAQPPAAGAPAQPFTAPTVAGQPEGLPSGTVPPDLIASTDPAQRLQQISGNRADPFAVVPSTPIVVRSPLPAGTSTAPSAAGSSAQPGSASGPGRLAPIPSLVPNRPPSTTTTTTVRPAAPPPPQPDLARAVQVTGVIQIGSVPHAIVQAPNEPTSRYVRVGQRLSNGAVLVKRIDMRGPEPVVVLEQVGVEVEVAVGEGGPPPTPGQPTASAALPQLAANPAL